MFTLMCWRVTRARSKLRRFTDNQKCVLRILSLCHRLCLVCGLQERESEREREGEKERERRRRSTISKRRRDEKLINYIDTQRRNWVNDKWEADEGRRRLLSPFVWNSSYCHRCYSYIAVIWLLVIGLVSLDRSFRQNSCVL